MLNAAAIPLLFILSYFVSLSHLALITIASLLVIGICRYYSFVSRFPQGPFPLPFIGNLDRHRQNIRKGKEYPPIYTIFMSFPYVQINDFDVLREAFIEKGDEFAGQPDDEYLLEGAEKSRDFNYERLWDVMEELIRLSISDFMEHLDKITDKR
ncbi:hypothetical protein PRIPAC_81306 [Pristionchus pacificus]|nr:hypothetical protein PRIPAC_81306 [Pristionchus pacificus]